MADALLTIENLTKSFGDKLLFEDISFGVNAGQKTALIARNGYGKSTLLNIITGKELPDSGKVTFRATIHKMHKGLALKNNTCHLWLTSQLFPT